MLLEIDAEGAQTLEGDVLHILRGGFEDHLKLSVLIEAIGILAVTTVGGPTAGLYVADPVGGRSEHAKKSFRGHGAGAHFHIVRLLQDAALIHPKMRELQDQFLEGEALRFFLKFYFNFQVASSGSRVASRRSR